MGDFLAAFGLVFVIEGLIFAAFPGPAKRAMMSVIETPEASLRLIGVGSAVVGLPNSRISIVEPGSFEKRFRLAAGAATSLRFAAVIFAVSALDKVRSALAASGIAYHVDGAAIVVPPSPGQGAAFIFEETP